MSGLLRRNVRSAQETRNEIDHASFNREMERCSLSRSSLSSSSSTSVNANSSRSQGYGPNNLRILERPNAPEAGDLPCVMAPKLQPAVEQERILVTTNIFPLEVEDRVVYRYDVTVSGVVPPGTRDSSKKDLVSASRLDPNRQRMCILLLRTALEKYRELREGEWLYDARSTLFANQPIDTKTVIIIIVIALLFYIVWLRFVGSLYAVSHVCECAEIGEIR
ncbi:hypothetical protein AB6A40_011435 [Gnathostoma spinigerum]|uniref:Protein argonaute N-terminal domain-containing protein n=1 Tax=Gnathostoma spinigerum TaxID=75299 RepID=A0ABD6EXS9_9BILA